MDEYRKYEPIFGSWYLSKLLGKGSFGRVYEITREEYGTTYKAALKIISVPQDEDDIKTRMTEGTDMNTISEYYEGILKEIINENEIMSQLKGNSNIVSYEDHQIIPHEDGIGYDILIRMELLTPLIDRLVERELSEKDVVKLGIDICKALELCHKKNIIHRDIKPQNIFVSENGDYKLGDFGIARTMEKTIGGMSKKGTYKYMAPEVFKGEDYDSTVDIYSLGIVLFSLLNGNRGPFLPPPPAKITHNDEEEARVRRFRGESLPSPRDGSEMLAFIIKKACAAQREDRYLSAELMRKDLESYYNNYSAYDSSFRDDYDDEKTAVEYGARTNNRYTPVKELDISNYNDRNNSGSYYGRDNGRIRTVEKEFFPGGKKGIAFLILAVFLFAAAVAGAVVIKNTKDKPDHTVANEVVEEKPAEQINPKDGINVLGRDINFSQVDSLAKEPVDVIIWVQNNLNEPINKVNYEIKYDTKKFINRKSNGTTFTAYGYVKPGEYGYLYGRAEFDKKTPRKQGGIEITDAQTCKEIEGYTFPYGEVVSFNEKKDTYNVEIYNPNNRQVNPGNSIVIAHRDDDSELADAWGCGVVKQTIYPGETVVLKDVIHDPGFGVPYDEAHYTAFIIEKDLLGITE